jgi:ligand-binding sensor domain-containing protein/signal transduction histidine kinase
LALTFTASSRAERPPFKVYTTAEGLAHDSVNKIVRDSRGFLWFCTAEGLSRFDGYRFKNYTQDQGLPHRNINDFLEARDGTYLIATSAGLSVFNPHGKAYRWNIIQSKLEQTADDPPLFQTFVPQERAIKQTNNILSLAQDRQDVIWAGTRNGLFQIRKTGDGLEFQEFEVENWKDKGLSYTDLLADSEGGLFVGSNAAVYRISPDGNLRKLTEYASGVIFQDRDGKLWVNTATELKVFSFANDTLELLKTYSQKDGLPPNAGHFTVKQISDGRIFVGFEYGFSEFLADAKENEPKFRIFAVEKINSMAEDGGGNLWVGTDSKGAWKLAHTGFTIFGEQDGISPSDEIMSVFSDRDGEVYAVARPNRLSHLTGGKFESVLPFGLAKRSWGWHFLDLLSQDDEWWIPTENGLRRYPKVAKFADLARTPPKRIYTTADGVFANGVFNQFEDSRGDIWFSVIGAGPDTLLRWERKTDRIVPYTTADGLPAHNGPISFAEDSHGNMWFGYYFGGMARYHDGKFRLFTEPDGLPSSQVGDLLADSLGRLWIATSGRGLFRLDDTNAEKPVFTILSTANGLSSNQPLCLTEDRFGRIYVGTGRGINRVDRNDSVKVFTQEDGLPSNYITRCAADKNGNLWFVTRNTLVRFVPEIEQAAIPPLVFIDRILVNGVPQKISELGETETRPLELESAQRQIQIDFFALSIGTGENIRYQYRLDDQDWSNPSKQQTLNLDLAPGKHSLLVRAVRSDGIASEKPAIVAIRILPPIWLRWWFVGLAALLVAAFLYSFYRYRTARFREVNAALAEKQRAEEALGRSRTERLAELERVRARIATDLHDDIGSSLTQIAILSEVAHQQTAAGASENGSEPIARIISVSNELVDTMSDIVWAINPKKDHLSDLLQRMRRFASDVFTARQIAFQFRAPDAGRDIELGANVRREVFLIFKESVNNVVKHSGCSRAEIEFQIEGDWLVLKVTDNGKGFDSMLALDDSAPVISTARGGNGLPSMRKRAQEIGGRFEIVSGNGEGTTATLRMLISQQPPENK